MNVPSESFLCQQAVARYWTNKMLMRSQSKKEPLMTKGRVKLEYIQVVHYLCVCYMWLVYTVTLRFTWNHTRKAHPTLPKKLLEWHHAWAGIMQSDTNLRATQSIAPARSYFGASQDIYVQITDEWFTYVNIWNYVEYGKIRECKDIPWNTPISESNMHRSG